MTVLFIKNTEILKKYIKYQMRYARYLQKVNLLTYEIYNRDYYPNYGNDSTKLLNDCYDYVQ